MLACCALCAAANARQELPISDAVETIRRLDPSIAGAALPQDLQEHIRPGAVFAGIDAAAPTTADIELLTREIEWWQSQLHRTSRSALVQLASSHEKAHLRACADAVLTLCQGAQPLCARFVPLADAAGDEDGADAAMHLLRTVLPLRSARATLLLAITIDEMPSARSLLDIARSLVRQADPDSDWSIA